MADISRAIRTYALRPTRDLQRDPNSMVCLEHCLVESFLMPLDWEEHALWSDEWRTFALLVAEALTTERSRAERYKHALTWALGSNGDFRARELGEGAFWWRKELQARAGLEWDGKKFIDGDVRWMLRPHATAGVPETRGSCSVCPICGPVEPGQVHPKPGCPYGVPVAPAPRPDYRAECWPESPHYKPAAGVPASEPAKRHPLCGKCMTPHICAEDGPGCTPGVSEPQPSRKEP